jgi:hypothetical protein
MQTITVILCLGLLLWVEPASAQKVYSLKVRIHEDVPRLTDEQVNETLDRASKLLKKNPGHQCNVTFKLKGHVETFGGAPKDISGPDDLEAVHRVHADVKVVNTINFCIGQYRPFWGCAWRPEGPKTVIVIRGVRADRPDDVIVGRDLRVLLWAHEFAHTKGLHHRIDVEQALMTPCEIEAFNTLITKDECTCIKKGPKGCPISAPAQDAVCPTR